MAFGDYKGGLSGTAGSITNPFAISTGGPVTVVVGDLVVAVLAQQTALTVTACSDNLGNTYTATNAGTDSGNATGRAFYSRVTVPGSLSSVSFATTASANDVAAVAAVFAGPFLVSPHDTTANPANVQDIASPFQPNATGTLAQANNLIVAWGTMNAGVTTWAATAPNVKRIDAATANIGGIIGSQVVAATTTVQPAFTNGVNPASSVLGVAAFKEERITADKWHKPLSHPTHRIATTALVVAGLVAPVYTPVDAPAAEVSVSASEWIVPYQRDLLYQSQFGPVPFDAPAEVVTLDKWHQPLSQPVRKVSTAPQSGLVFVGSDTARDTNWRRPISEPVRSNVRQVGPSTFLVGSEAPVSRWHQPLSEPVRQKAVPSSQVYGPVYVEVVGETVTLDKWHQPLSTPVRQKERTQPDSVTYVYPVPVSGADDVRFSGFTISVPYERTLLYQSLFEPVDSGAAPEVVTVDKWLKPLSEPTRRVSSHAQQARFGVFVGSDSARDARWFQALSTPIRRATRVDYPSFTYGYYVAPAEEVVTLDKWHQPLATPVRRGGLPTSEQRALAFVKAAPFPESTTVDRWHRPLSIPTRRAKTNTSTQLIRPPRVIVSDVVTVDKWHRPLNQPVRLKHPAGILARFGIYPPSGEAEVTPPAPVVDDGHGARESIAIERLRIRREKERKRQEAERQRKLQEPLPKLPPPPPPPLAEVYGPLLPPEQISPLVGMAQDQYTANLRADDDAVLALLMADEPPQDDEDEVLALLLASQSAADST
jgi:hypothetical protein